MDSTILKMFDSREGRRGNQLKNVIILKPIYEAICYGRMQFI